MFGLCCVCACVSVSILLAFTRVHPLLQCVSVAPSGSGHSCIYFLCAHKQNERVAMVPLSPLTSATTAAPAATTTICFVFHSFHFANALFRSPIYRCCYGAISLPLKFSSSLSSSFVCFCCLFVFHPGEGRKDEETRSKRKKTIHRFFRAVVKTVRVFDCLKSS